MRSTSRSGGAAQDGLGIKEAIEDGRYDFSTAQLTEYIHMKIQRFHHVAYRCRDAKETVEWYRRHLCMEFVMLALPFI